MLKLLIIADDFTGALDTGVQFSKQGAKTLVTTDPKIDFASLGNDIEVLSVDTESRHITPGAAYERVFELAERAHSFGVSCIYKKTDSTLRGNIGAELEAISRACGETVMFVPAYPKNNRTTKDGVQYVSGVPLGETLISKDPIDPVTLSSVTDIIALQSNMKAIYVPLVCCGRAHFSEPGCIYVFDSETDEDLDLVGWALKQEGKLRVLAGCAGFAEKLPGLLALPKADFSVKPHGGSVLLVSGSVNQVSLDQLDAAEAFGYKSIALTPLQKLGGGPEGDMARSKAAQNIINGLNSGGRIILRALGKSSEMADADKFAAEKCIDPKAIPTKVAGSMSAVVKEVMASGAVQNLAVFGGDTLLAVIDKLGGIGVIPHTEVAPGVVASTVLRDGSGFEVVTKAGGLGKAGVVGIIDNYLHG